MGGTVILDSRVPFSVDALTRKKLCVPSSGKKQERQNNFFLLIFLDFDDDSSGEEFDHHLPPPHGAHSRLRRGRPNIHSRFF